MNIEIIKSKYPKGYDKLMVWAKGQLTTLTGIPTDVVENFTGVALQALLPVALEGRGLYDFFDSYQIHMFPMGSIEWKFRIVSPASNHDNSENDENYTSRKLAEEAGFMKSFELLEKKLS